MIALLPILISVGCLIVYYMDKHCDEILNDQWRKILLYVGYSTLSWWLLSVAFIQREVIECSVVNIDGHAIILIDGSFININKKFGKNFLDGKVKISKNKDYSMLLWWPTVNSIELVNE